MKYALVVNGKIDTISYHPQSGWEQVQDDVFAGYVKSGQSWVPPQQSDEDAAVAARNRRDSMLEQTDWRALPDAPGRDAWLSYRQALRDVPQQAGFPHSVVWPIKPE